MLRFLFYLFIIAALTAAVTGVLIWTGPESQATLQPLPPQRVVTAEVRSIDFQPVRHLTGQLQPTRSARLHFEVSGQLIERHIEPGQQIATDEILLQLDAADYADAVSEAEAELTQERETLDRDRRLLELIDEQVALQEKEVERMDRLGQRSLASKSNYDTAVQSLLQLQAEAARLRYSVSSATARRQQREAAYNRAKRNLERTRLRAPFAATVDSVAVDVGDYVTPGQMATELVQLDELDLVLDVPGPVAATLSRGQSVEVTVPQNGDRKTRSGRIVALAAAPDTVTHTYKLRIRLSGSGLYPGQLVEARLPGLAYNDARIVPAAAILRDEGETYVFRVDDGKLDRLPVTIIQRHQDWQVIEGVAAGTMIVARDVAALADGQPVSVQ